MTDVLETPAVVQTRAQPLAFEFDGVVRLTRVGATYIGAAVILAVAAVNTGNNALYIAVSVMLGCLLLSGVASKDGLKRLFVEISGIEEAWATQPSEGMLRIRNASHVWNVRDVVLTSESLAAPIFIPILLRGETVDVRASFLFSRRGLAHVEKIDSYTRYPFGFVLKKRRLHVSSEVIVYPRLLSQETVRQQFPAVFGEDAPTNRIGSGTELHSFRDFSSGDSMRRVHWKKSAAVGRWIMKQNEAEAGGSVHIIVNPYKPDHVSDEAFEEMISAAATFIHDAVRRGLEVTLSLPRMAVRARSDESAAPLFRALALVEATREPLHQRADRHAVLFDIHPEETS